MSENDVTCNCPACEAAERDGVLRANYSEHTCELANLPEEKMSPKMERAYKALQAFEKVAHLFEKYKRK